MAEKEIPLRLNKRRDGTMVLVNADGANREDRVFPPRHAFTWDYLAGPGRAFVRLEGDTIQLELLNGRATYQIDQQGPGGVSGTLVESELFDAPPIDEDAADLIHTEREAALAADAGAASATVANAGTAVVEPPANPPVDPRTITGEGQ